MSVRIIGFICKIHSPFLNTAIHIPHPHSQSLQTALASVQTSGTNARTQCANGIFRHTGAYLQNKSSMIVTGQAYA